MQNLDNEFTTQPNRQKTGLQIKIGCERTGGNSVFALWPGSVSSLPFSFISYICVAGQGATGRACRAIALNKPSYSGHIANTNVGSNAFLKKS